MYWKYFAYVIRHKWFVFVAGLRVNVSFVQLLMHDLSKFSPAEFFAYAEYFNGEKNDRTEQAFKVAWNNHQKYNKHHWQHWVLINDSDEPKITPLVMPVKYADEMVADWMGAGRAITGKWEVHEWYAKSKEKIILHPATRDYVEFVLQTLKEEV